MKILFSSYHNPHFITISEYIERAISKLGHELVVFDDYSFTIPYRILKMLPFLERMELNRINRNLIELVKSSKPDLAIIAGGNRILPATVTKIRSLKCKTALWTSDPPYNFAEILKAAPNYDHIFCQGSEAADIFAAKGIRNANLLPMACDPEIHAPKILSEEEIKRYACDIAFVGSISPSLYPFRVQALEQLAGYDVGIWGPGADSVPDSSPIKKLIRGTAVTPEIWTKIYSCARIVLCMHYKDPKGIVLCHQASPRVFETLACGAFLLVDKQKDLLPMFEDGKQLAYFKDKEDLSKKIEYYLSHPEERTRIAKAGYDYVREKHTYTQRIEELLSEIKAPSPLREEEV